MPHSSPMEGAHTPTIIWLILSMDLALIQLKNSLFNSSFFNNLHNKWRFKELTHKQTDSIVKGTLEKMHPDRRTRSWIFHSESFISLTG